MTMGWLASTRPEYDRFNLLSARIDLILNAIVTPLFVMSTLLLSVGYIGLLLRYSRTAGSFGRLSLGLGALSGIVSAVAAISMEYYETEHLWPIWFLAMVFQLLGLTLFGIANIRQPSLPRWNGLPILAGVWIPLFVIVGLTAEQVSGSPWVVPNIVSISLLLLTMAGLVSLGYLLQSDAAALSTENA
jgi:hypothetical protein